MWPAVCSYPRCTAEHVGAGVSPQDLRRGFESVDGSGLRRNISHTIAPVALYFPAWRALTPLIEKLNPPKGKNNNNNKTMNPAPYSHETGLFMTRGVRFIC